MAAATPNSIYRDGKLIARGVAITKVKPTIRKNAKEDPIPGNPQVYRVKREKQFDKSFRVIRGQVKQVPKAKRGSN